MKQLTKLEKVTEDLIYLVNTYFTEDEIETFKIRLDEFFTGKINFDDLMGFVDSIKALNKSN